MRLAYFTPLPPSKSRIAQYSSELLPYLAKGAEIFVFVADEDELRGSSDARVFRFTARMYQFDVVTIGLVHSLMRFDAEWRGDIISEPERESVTLR